MASASSTREQPLWSPTPQWRAQTEMDAFMRWAGARHGRDFGEYAALWEWSVANLEDFWADIWEFCGVRASRGYERVLGDRQMPGASWFPGSQLNYAENLLLGALPAAGRGAPARGSELAVLHCSELRDLDRLSWDELSAQVAAAAAGMRSLGVGRGDRVVAYMPNIPETVVALLATASIGAIWSSAAPEFGARSVIDRFAQIEPKLLLAVDGYRHGGKDFDRRGVLDGILAELPTVEHVVELPYLSAGTGAGDRGAGGGEGPGRLAWDELLALGEGQPLQFEQVPFDHPLWVLYSSGTTGLPKAIVHGHGGILVEQLKKRLHLDLRPGDRMFWFTTTGWMMWNFLVGSLHSEAAIVLYDGSPAHPDLGALWDLAERTGMTCLGASAGLMASAEKAGIQPGREHDLSALRAIGSTGSPLAPESFRWIYEQVDPDVWLYSTSGGTDVCTAFVGGCPVLPVYEGELQARMLGCAVAAWDGEGRSVVDEVGGARDHRADALDAVVLLGRRGRGAAAGELLLHVPGGVAARRLDSHHPPGRGVHLRALGLDHQPPGGADGDERDLPGGRHRSRVARRARGGRAPGRVGRAVDAAVRGARTRGEARRAADGADQAEDPRGLLAPPRAERRAADRGGAEDAVGEGAGGARQADPDGRPARPGGERGLARQPAVAGLLRGARRNAEGGVSYSPSERPMISFMISFAPP